MKIFEIIDTKVKQVKPRKFNQAVRDRVDDGNIDRPGPNTLGQGSFARVEKHKNAQGMVIKYGRNPALPDKIEGYIAFLKKLMVGDRMSSNPYLPRVYNVVLMGENDQYVVTLEHLIRFEKLTSGDMKAIGDLAFGDIDKLIDTRGAKMRTKIQRMKASGHPRSAGLEAIFHQRPEPRRPDDVDHDMPGDAVRYHSHIVAFMQGILNGTQGIDIIHDPKLKQALLIMKKVMQEHPHVNADIRMPNIMARRGPVGAQMVITDPLA